MVSKKATIEIECDEELENKIENKLNNWANSCGANNFKSSNGGGAVYCLGVIGALVYFIQTATSFWIGVLGILKALVWPAFLVFEFLKFFKL